MQKEKRVNLETISLPSELIKWIGNAPIYESNGLSGARTFYIDRDKGAFLKIAPSKSLFISSKLQLHLAKYGLSSPVIMYISKDKDYLLSESLKGSNGVSSKYLSEPERLSKVFGLSLKLLHEVDIPDFPIKNKMSDLILMSNDSIFLQDHLDLLSDYIGISHAEEAKEEILSSAEVLNNNAIIHGDYCLPNIILDKWKFKGFVDFDEGGIGDRHYDIAWGLWSLAYNFKSSKYGQIFLDAYGRENIDKEALRICGLLAAME
jgi:kanamycin kinase